MDKYKIDLNGKTTVKNPIKRVFPTAYIFQSANIPRPISSISMLISSNNWYSEINRRLAELAKQKNCPITRDFITTHLFQAKYPEIYSFLQRRASRPKVYIFGDWNFLAKKREPLSIYYNNNTPLFVRPNRKYVLTLCKIKLGSVFSTNLNMIKPNIEFFNYYLCQNKLDGIYILNHSIDNENLWSVRESIMVKFVLHCYTNGLIDDLIKLLNNSTWYTECDKLIKKYYLNDDGSLINAKNILETILIDNEQKLHIRSYAKLKYTLRKFLKAEEKISLQVFGSQYLSTEFRNYRLNIVDCTKYCQQESPLSKSILRKKKMSTGIFVCTINKDFSNYESIDKNLKANYNILSDMYHT